MSENKPKFVRPLTEVQVEIQRLQGLLATEMSAEQIAAQIENLYLWLAGLAQEIAEASSGRTRFEASELFEAQRVLKAFLDGFELASELANRTNNT